MAKIVYGVSGQGFGHSTRSKEIIRHLIGQGHEILVFTYGQALFFLGEDFEVFEVPGLGLCYKNNRLVYSRTICQNIIQVGKQSKNWKQILNRFRDFGPDLVITDFEPTSAILAKIQRLPLISIDNQHQLTNTKIKLPLRYQADFLADQLVVRSIVWGAKHYLITSFFETKTKRKDTFVFPPILRQEIIDLKPIAGDYFLVYQTSSFDSLVETLKKINEKFVVFGFNLEKKEGNIEFKNYSSHEFLSYLANCRAVIGNAGLSLISESLHLEKPYLAIPVKKQIEQVVNADYLQNNGYGLFAKKFNQEKFEEFLGNLPTYQANLEKYSKNDNGKIFKKIEEIIEKCSLQ